MLTNTSFQFCHQCSALKLVPHLVVSQSTCDPPEGVGLTFAADVLKQNRQLILVVRESSTSYTASSIVDSEGKHSLRDALICLIISLRPLDGPSSVIRIDPAPGFASLVDDSLLQQHRISIEVGHQKNANRNPVVERAVQELGDEVLHQDPLGSIVTTLSLATATAQLNEQIHYNGLSAREL